MNSSLKIFASDVFFQRAAASRRDSSLSAGTSPEMADRAVCVRLGSPLIRVAPFPAAFVFASLCVPFVIVHLLGGCITSKKVCEPVLCVCVCVRVCVCVCVMHGAAREGIWIPEKLEKSEMPWRTELLSGAVAVFVKRSPAKVKQQLDFTKQDLDKRERELAQPPHSAFLNCADVLVSAICQEELKAVRATLNAGNGDGTS